MGDAAVRWTKALQGWAIPQHILDAAPESPWGFPPSLFKHTPEQAQDRDTPSIRRSLEALPPKGTVLDVGVGVGAGSLPLAPKEPHIIGVDESEEMLAAFRDAAKRMGLSTEQVQGRWPDVAGEVQPADVVVCHHVFYNTQSLDEFASALTSHAHHRVVVELMAMHPMSRLNPLWRRFHGIERPTRPTADDAIAVLEEAGIDPGVERWESPPRMRHADRSEFLAFVRRRLCVTPDKDEEIDRLLESSDPFPPREMVTLWWPGTAHSL